MPTYAYQCRSCSHQFEEWQKISDEPLVTCPACKQNTLVRIIAGGAGLIFKGSGFYLTDYKRDNTKGTKEPSKPAEKKTEAPAGEKPAKGAEKPEKPKS